MASSLDAVFYARASLRCLLAAPDVLRGNQVKRSGLIVVGGDEIFCSIIPEGIDKLFPTLILVLPSE